MGGAFLLAAGPHIGDVVNVGGITMSHGCAGIVVGTRGAAVAVLLQAIPPHQDLALQPSPSVRADTVLATQ